MKGSRCHEDILLAAILGNVHVSILGTKIILDVLSRFFGRLICTSIYDYIWISSKSLNDHDEKLFLFTQKYITLGSDFGANSTNTIGKANQLRVRELRKVKTEAQTTGIFLLSYIECTSLVSKS